MEMANEGSKEEELDNGDVMWNEEDETSEESDMALMAATHLMNVERALANNAFLHGYISSDICGSALLSVGISDGKNFNGVIIDTAANRRSIMSLNQYRAYQSEFGRKVPMRPARKDVKGIGGRSTVLGEVTIQIPFSKLNLIIDVEFSILPDDTPSLLSNKDIIENGLDISLQGGYLYIDDARQPLIFENFFYIYKWKAPSIPYVLYTEQELRRIHRVFGHPSVAATHNLLKRASKTPLNTNVRKQLERLAEDCNTCRRNGTSPRRFKLIVGSDDLIFNNKVVVDTMFLDGRAVLHMVDEATHFSAATFLRKQSARRYGNA